MKFKTSIFLLACLLVLTSVSTVFAFSPNPPFMTIDEFISRHHKQGELMETFNDIVRDPCKDHRIDKTIKIKVAFIYPANQISDYWRRSITSFKRRMNEIRANYTLTEYFSTPDDNPALLEKQIREAISSDPDYLVFTLDVFKHKGLVEELLRRKRPKLILQNITTPLREWEGNQPFMYIGFDHAAGTRLIADYYLKKTNGLGKYGLLYFTKGYVSTMRGNTFLNYVGVESHLKMVANAFTMGDKEIARKEALLMLDRHPDLKFIYATSTDIAMGAIEALKESGKIGQVMINGWGGGSSELEAILKGDMDVTVMRMNDDNGVAMAEAIAMDVEGLGEYVPTIYSGEMLLVEKGISRKELDTLIERAFRYSGK